MPSHMQHSVYAHLDLYAGRQNARQRGKARRWHVTTHVISEVAVAWIWREKDSHFPQSGRLRSRFATRSGVIHTR